MNLLWLTLLLLGAQAGGRLHAEAEQQQHQELVLLAVGCWYPPPAAGSATADGCSRLARACHHFATDCRLLPGPSFSSMLTCIHTFVDS